MITNGIAVVLLACGICGIAFGIFIPVLHVALMKILGDKRSIKQILKDL